MPLRADSAARGISVSRRAAIAGGAVAALSAATRGAVAQDATPVASGPFEARLSQIRGNALYPPFTTWGIHVRDLKSGETLYDLNGEDRFVPGSTTKLWPSAAALVAYGPDYRFVTPVYRQGEVADGVLDGDLILVASGDMSLGGRDLPDGTMAYTNIDHTDANAVPGYATLVPTNPLAGLDNLAAQVAKAGITRAKDVIVDARLWDQMVKDSYVLSPIMVNDNVVDVTITPGNAGEAATIVSRPETAFFELDNQITTGPAGSSLTFSPTLPEMGKVILTGSIAADSQPLIQTVEVVDPPAFARALFIESLVRHGVAVDAPVQAPNPADRLPATGSYDDANKVASFTSLPFSEQIKVILKVSLNRDADTLVFLIALKDDGKNTFDDGLQAIGTFVASLGIDRKLLSLGDGRGDDRADLFSPSTISDLMAAMAGRPEGAALRDALPILGVDGTEWMSLPKDSPALGKVVAKSGTTAVGDLVNQRILVLGKADAGYITAASGRELVWAVYVNDVPIEQVDGVLGIAADIGSVAEAIFAAF